MDAQVRQLTHAGCKKVLREVASGAKTERRQVRRALDQLAIGDVLMVTRLDRPARSTRDLLNPPSHLHPAPSARFITPIPGEPDRSKEPTHGKR